MFLPRLTVLNEQYAIGRTLDSADSFAISYQAWDLKTEDQVDLKEYFPSALAARADDGIRVESQQNDLFRYGRDQFLKEAQVLAKIAHPNLARQVQYFEANQTAYRAIEHHPGALLASVLQKKGGTLPLKTAITLLMPILDALQAAHQHGLMHGAISPQSVFLSKSSGPILRDFCTAHIMLAQRMGDAQALVEEGMVAPEQHQTNGKQGPWTDIYGAAAMLYELLIGQSLPTGPQRLQKDDVPALLQEATRLKPALRDLLARALSLDLSTRPRSVQAFQQQLVQALEQKEQAVVVSPPAPAGSTLSAKEETPVAEKEEVSVRATTLEKSEKPIRKTGTPASMPVEAKATTSAGKKNPLEITGSKEPVLEKPAPKEVARKESVQPLVISEEMPPFMTVEIEPAQEQSPAASITEPVPSARDWADRVAKAKIPQKEEAKTPEVISKEPVSRSMEAEVKHVPQKTPKKPEKTTTKTAVSSVPSEPTSSKKEDRKKTRKQKRSTDRASQPSKKRFIPVLVAFFVIVVVAVLGAFALLKEDSSAQTQFAYFKTQGDSLFALANYADAKTEYERALTARPSDEEVVQQLDATNQRLAEVSAERYAEHMAQGDLLYTQADSLLQAGDALASLSYFNEANKAYYEALRYRPDDPEVLEKGQLTANGMDQALNQNSDAAARATEEDAERVDPVLIRQELYDGYRKQGDTLFGQEDYRGAREKYSMALSNQPGDTYASNRIRQIDTLLEEASTAERYQGHISRGTALCQQGRCAEAKVEFQRALELNPGSAEAQAGIARADSMMASVQQQDQQYQYHRGQGDALVAKGSYEDAISSYEQALTYKPGDAYIEQQITNARQAASAKEEALTRRDAQGGIYKVADEAPQLIGGLSALHQNVQYPRRAYDAGVTGRVYVQFVVNEKGRVEDAKVMRGIGSGCDEEALRVVKQARFEPGRVNGQPVKVQHTLFINFAKPDREEE